MVSFSRPSSCSSASGGSPTGEWTTAQNISSSVQRFCLAAHDNIDVEEASRILDWARRLEDWTTASVICIAICRWYGEHGRLEDMRASIERLLPHATGMQRLILRGHLASIATNHGDYRTGLTENQQLETDLQDLPRDGDYYLNLQATITQQIDCLRELGRLDEA